MSKLSDPFIGCQMTRKSGRICLYEAKFKCAECGKPCCGNHCTRQGAKVVCKPCRKKD